MSAVETPMPPVEAIAPPSAAPAPAAVRPERAESLLDGRLPALLVFAVVFGASAAVLHPHPLGVFTDDGMYAILAKSLVEGRGYRFINLPGAPPGTHFPPVYPALLALLWKLWPSFPDNVLLFKGVNAMLNGVAAVLLFRLASHHFAVPRGVAMVVAIVAGIGLPSLLLGSMVLSEPLFLVGLLAALPLAERVRRAPTDRSALLLGAAGGVLVLTRSIGVTFVAGTLLALLLSRRWRAAALVAAASAAFVVPWNVWTARHDGEIAEHQRGKYGSYSGWLGQGVERHGPAFVGRTVARNLPQSALMMGESLRVPRFEGMPPLVWTHWIGLAAAIGLGLMGMLALAWLAPVTAATFAAYVGMVLVWPFEPTRFLWGVWPLFMGICAAGACAAIRRAAALAPRWRGIARGAVGTLAAAALVGAVAHAQFSWSHGWSSSVARERTRSALPVVFWVQEHTAPGDLVSSDDETMVYLYAGRQGVPNTRFTPDEYLFPRTDADRRADLDTMIARNDPDWLVVSMPAVRGVARAREAEVGDIRQVHTLPDGSLVFARNRASTR